MTLFLRMNAYAVSICITLLLCFAFALTAHALMIGESGYSTTTVQVSICGDLIINSGEECDVPGETGVYSTTIAGRQCSTICRFGPYCGDAVLQTIYGEECDDGNNVSNDFCSAECLEETADSGGGNSGGGGGGGGNSGTGGRDTALGDTQVTVTGEAYPNATVNILIDGDSVGTVRTNSRGEFQFNTDTDPGTASFSFWAVDNSGTRSATLNTTFDITQGAVTNVSGILLPPTIRASKTQINPGEAIILSGQSIPSTNIEVYIDKGSPILKTTSDAAGNWTITYSTTGLSANTHTAKARFIKGTGALKTESTFGTALSLFVGVAGKPTSNADLNRDGSINLIDFSILIFWWGTPGGSSNPPADINGNGKVSLEDFSILLFNWTG